VVTIDDPDEAVSANQLLDAVQELRDAGAEAIAINDHRVGVQSAFTQDGERVVLDGVRLETPYRVVAIGAPDTLDAGLAIPGGIVDTLTAAKGVKVTVNRQADVSVPALESPPSFRAARPVTSDP
jgi:uncharacterized protein YlxW (UPF0749 family)